MNKTIPLANGLRTDHPVPDLPFVDDSHLPLEDPTSLQALGRTADATTWGRADLQRATGAWLAFTTEPTRPHLAWAVRHHPNHGTTVLLIREQDASSMHTQWADEALLFRAGGYWWDGATWYRPGQVWDSTCGSYARRPVASATTVYAADLVADGDLAQGRIHPLDAFEDPDAGASPNWLDDLALWADVRSQRDAKPHLSGCVVRLAAPELTDNQLIAEHEFAQIGGIDVSDLDAHLADTTSDVPLPQATLAGHHWWSQPVVGDWAERRRRNPDSLVQVIAEQTSPSAPGPAEQHNRLRVLFASRLWQSHLHRGTWSADYPSIEAVDEVAAGLAADAMADLAGTLPVQDLAATVQSAIVNELVTHERLLRDAETGQFTEVSSFDMAPAVSRILDWLIRHQPAAAAKAISQAIGEAARGRGIPDACSARVISQSLHVSKLDRQVLRDYLERVLPPAGIRQELGSCPA
ncbi:hypothetical protein BIV57_04145 [Mangrovactinospora gilvigrisea]|uniref:Uncharacterized protein n=1 Tax=Mangrovactinospora gilvigrisea TaxID=1428644 RepID=A0A1J7BZ41_9ACTN|nr:hypothetical protein [Mangrovactinospora gilvigrisea]OIV38745.1 hypothetical protein BIV57_04145 [Mangrovactinospora gilvigrisea]